MKGIITQSNYIPWAGFFSSMNMVDIFVVYDEMQFTKRDWRNRNLINTPKGLKWLTIPICVKGNYLQKINECKISNFKWNIDHWNIIKENYKNAKYYKEISMFLEPLYKNCNHVFLTDINLYFINALNHYLNINTKIITSPVVDKSIDRNQRLIKICKDFNIINYFSGPSAKAYIEPQLFTNQNINLIFWDYNEFIKKLNRDSELKQVSIIDSLFNEGPEIIKSLSVNTNLS